MYKKNNINTLKESESYLYRSLNDSDTFSRWLSNDMYRYDINIYTQRSRENTLVTYIDKNKITYRLNSCYYPTSEAVTWASVYSPEQYGRTNRVFYIFGLGDGYFIRELIKVIDNYEIVLIYEPSIDIFLHTMENYNLENIINKPNVIIYVNGLSYGKWADILSDYSSDAINGNNVYITLPQYDKLFPEERQEFNKIYANHYFNAMGDRNTMRYFGSEWALACIENLQTALQSKFLGDYRNTLPEDIPVIVVAAGPSLQVNIKDLKKAKGKSVIIAVDTVLNYLEENDINPDVIITVDVHKPMYLFNNKTAREQTMITAIMSNPSAIKYNKGDKIFFDVFQVLEKFIELPQDYSRIQISGCVATMAFEVARYLGAKKIILVGQDLAYTGKVTHAGGIVDGLTESRFAQVEGNDGEKLWTRQDWYSYLTWYNREVALFDGIVINATERGAKIEGTIVMKLDQAIEQYCIKPYQANYLFMEKDNNEQKVINTSNCNSLIREELVLAEILIKEAYDICEYLIKDSQKNKEESYVSMKKAERLSMINEELRKLKTWGIIEVYIYEYAIPEYDEIFNRYKEKSQNRVNVYERALNIYKASCNATEDILLKLDSVDDLSINMNREEIYEQ